MTSFEQNVRYFEKLSPQGAAKLSFTEDKPVKRELLSITPTEKIVIIYGVGALETYHSLKQWLQSDRRHLLLFIDDDLAEIGTVLGEESTTNILRDPQVRLIHIESRESLEEIAWSLFPEEFQLISAPSKQKQFEQVQKAFLFTVTDIYATLHEYHYLGTPFFQQFWRNLFLLPDSYNGQKLFQQFKGVPAICVAAGPSLNHHFERLKKLKDHALIFAGGSAITALYNRGIDPHFGVAIDPNPEQISRFEHIQRPIPFFYRLRLYHEAAKKIRGPKLYLRGGDGYNISDYFEKKLKIRGGRILGGGHGVSNFSIDIAHALGCSPIILVGYDLALTGDQHYAEGVPGHSFSHQDEKVLWTDFEGKPIVTLYKWLTEAQWISDFKKKKKIKLYNATEGGLKIKGVKNITLQEAQELFLQSSYSLHDRIHNAIEGVGKLKCSREDIIKAISTFQYSLEGMEKMDDFSEDTIAYTYLLQVFDQMRTKLDYYKKNFYIHPDFSEGMQDKIEEDLATLHSQFLKMITDANILFAKNSVL